MLFVSVYSHIKETLMTALIRRRFNYHTAAGCIGAAVWGTYRLPPMAEARGAGIYTSEQYYGEMRVCPQHFQTTVLKDMFL